MSPTAGEIKKIKESWTVPQSIEQQTLEALKEIHVTLQHLVASSTLCERYLLSISEHQKKKQGK